METIIFHDLSKLGITSLNKPDTNSFRLYIAVDKDGKLGTHNISFSSKCDFILDGFYFMNLAENCLTGEKFLNFSKDKGVKLRLLNKDSKAMVGTTKNTVVKYICDFLKIKRGKGVHARVAFSNNLSLSSDYRTYKILDIIN